MNRIFTLGSIFLVLSSLAQAGPPTLSWMFQDSMVLQQGTQVPVWGTAKAGVSVAVEFGGQKKEAMTDARGKWLVKLDPMIANAGSRDMKVISEEGITTIRDVVVGEVWVAAGQSNMAWPLSDEMHAKSETTQAKFSKLRLLNLTHVKQSSFGPDALKRLTGEGFYQGAWTVCTPQSAGDFSAIAYYFGKEIHQEMKVPVGIIHLAVGGSPAEAWIRRDALAADDEMQDLVKGNWLENKNLEAWCRQRGRDNLAGALKEKKEVPKDDLGPNHPFKPGFLWDAGIARIIPFSIRGVIWHQGESNSLDPNRVRQHERLFPMLVNDWRKQWGIGKFPFYYCQLSSIGTEKGYKSHYWPEFRDSQRRLLAEISNTGMAVTSDVGNPVDVHPRNKRDVGHRLAILALARTYEKKLSYSGPLVKSVRRDGASLVVSFDYTDGGLKTSDGQAPKSFEIAGGDGMFYPAVSTLDKTTAVLTNGKVVNPMTARYGWQPDSKGNLTNGAGLPASTFQQGIGQGIRVMTFNILQGGEDASNVGFGNRLFHGSRFDDLANVIRVAKADVVGVQEDCGSDKLLEALGEGWHRVGSIYSKHPLKKVKAGPYLTVVELRLPGDRPLQVVNCHWTPPIKGYGPDLAQAELKANPRLEKLSEMTKRIVEKCGVPNGHRGYNTTLKAIRTAMDSRLPIILTGDFNEPSHLDWTDAFAKHGPDRWVKNPTGTPLRFAVDWPGSKALEAIGMIDAYRRVHQDEVKKPGYTWTPEYPDPTPGRRLYGEQCLDRIDRIYFHGAEVQATSAKVVGEKGEFADIVYGGIWPSDHRAVLVTFMVK